MDDGVTIRLKTGQLKIKCADIERLIACKKNLMTYRYDLCIKENQQSASTWSIKLLSCYSEVSFAGK
ncbi:MAG: hypothetical protein QM738_20480 [Ferruginibacter sp.]